MISTRANTSLVICTVTAFWYFGGRFSIAFSVLVVYAVVYDREHEAILGGQKGSVKSTAEVPIVSIEKSKKKCCGGKNGGCCSSKNKIGEEKKSSCCGGDCKSKKLKNAPISEIAIEETIIEKNIENDKESSSSFPMAVDFTQSFRPKNKSKTTSKPLKKFTRTKYPVKGPNKKDDLVKSAMTISNETLLSSQIYIFYSSLLGSAERNAQKILDVLSELPELKLDPILLNIDELDEIDDYFVDVPVENALYILVLPSYDTNCPLDYFLQTLEENFNDFRIDRYPLKNLVGYTVLGLGDSESWSEKFCYQARNADHWLARLGGRRVFPIGEICMKTDSADKVEEWANLLCDSLKDDEPILYEYDETVESEDEEENNADELIDVEDIGKSEIGSNSMEIKKMVAKNSPTYKQLTKQGYTIVGSHSGVKICRWTKSDLRGTGSCYKQSLFNIVSSRCMEMTPSLACSSKCVFCWRHGTNPVSKTWRWEVDDPEEILEGALQGHYSKIKQMRGVPGVIAERFANAFQVRHCALSLVGEPIMYPYINRYVELLHEKGISSFLVCNAQHPEALHNIGKVTQLYVSIDAPTKTELKKVDRPLFKDFWERMVECLEILKTKQSHQRTVFRLTLVKGFNMGDISAYADLVERGLPCFIEVKGATFSGTSSSGSNPLTMQNIPFYEECIRFVNEFTTELQRRGLGYGVAAEHAHSNCILISSTKFKVNDEWYTHIDFDKFFELLATGEEFTYLDYITKTPEWALFGNGGFAPGNTRVYRKGKNKNKHLNPATDMAEAEEKTISAVPISA